MKDVVIFILETEENVENSDKAASLLEKLAFIKHGKNNANAKENDITVLWKT